MSARRLWVVLLILLSGGAIVVARAVQVAVVDGEKWCERARRQQQQRIRVPSPRGTIWSADGYMLATSIERVAVQVDTKHLEQPELFAHAAAPLLDIDGDELARRLIDGPRTVWLAKQTAPETGESVRELAPTAVALVPDFARVYPMGAVAAPVVGFVGREELRTVGRAGLEHHFDAGLAGDPRVYLAVNDAIRRKVRLERVESGRQGCDLELTLHARLQTICEAELRRALDEFDADAASAVVLDPWSGAVLALGSQPSFDPAAPGRVPAEQWRLRPVQDAIEPGSTVKPIVAAAALSAGVVAPGERFDCRQRGTRLAGFWIRDHAEPGRYTIDEVVVQSANTGIIEVAERIEPEHLYRAFAAFGFGRRSGIDFPAEARGLMPEVGSWSRLSRAGFALGQELTATPLQIALAYGAIANGGWLVEPTLVNRAVSEEISVDADGPNRIRVLDDALAARLTQMLNDVVEVGTGDRARMPGLRVAGKTGTAQLAINGGFDDTHHVAWFAGFLPVLDPKVVIVVALENPRTDFWGSTTAAPVFARIGEAAAVHLDLPRELRAEEVVSAANPAARFEPTGDGI
ncbi:MAG: penicillin-binding protein 2 [Thermoanaerobaculales bacterium]|jgi:cell division protein FtsI/penicillin-binding protein 2|nr:penicillin-binding protein 2 [Thermoanaerobaculales bacterium]